MHRIFVVLILFLLPADYLTLKGTEPVTNIEIIQPSCLDLYHVMDLEERTSYKALEQAVAGYNRIEGKKKDLLTLIDFTKPSTAERLFVIDMKNRKLLFASHVAHGRNSGGNYATSFSNINGSYKSSLGFYLTDNTYNGRNGYSLILDGLEKNINDKARERAIVMHGAPYADPSVIKASGRLGRSLGCPAIPPDISKSIIDAIKDGSVVYIYADDAQYLALSRMLTDQRIA